MRAPPLVVQMELCLCSVLLESLVSMGDRPGCTCLIGGTCEKCRFPDMTPWDSDSGYVQGDLKNLYFCEAAEITAM